jgi:L-lactate dehydrogenase complex protein LldF
MMGMEKVVAQLAHIVPLASLLTRSATGQAITTYFNLISGPRRTGEKDGPQEVHLVLLDNGRSQAYADAQLRSTLQCIRCGACMNHCPVYARIGGHATAQRIRGRSGKLFLRIYWGWMRPPIWQPPRLCAVPALKFVRSRYRFLIS